MKSKQLLKNKKFEVYEHLEHYVTKTSYTHRLQWLQESNNFVRLAQKKQIIRPVSK